VLINTIVYTRLLTGKDTSLRNHLGRAIGPNTEGNETETPPPAQPVPPVAAAPASSDAAAP
jgi:hypothetical protein